MPLSKGLGNATHLTQSSYRQAASETVRDLQNGGTGVIDCLLRVADMLRSARVRVRLEVVA